MQAARAQIDAREAAIDSAESVGSLIGGALMGPVGALVGGFMGNMAAGATVGVGLGEDDDGPGALGTAGGIAQRAHTPDQERGRISGQGGGGGVESGAQTAAGGGTTGQGAVRRPTGSGFQSRVDANQLPFGGLATTTRKSLLGV
jgi:hypothetical protein